MTDFPTPASPREEALITKGQAEGQAETLSTLARLLQVHITDLGPVSLEMKLKRLFVDAGIYNAEKDRFAVFHPHYKVRDDAVDAIITAVDPENGLVLDARQALMLLTSYRSLLAADFWCNFIYPEGASAQDVQNELSDFRFVMTQVPKVYSHITGHVLSKINYTAEAVIAQSDAYTQALIEAAVEEAREEWRDEHDPPRDID